MSNLFAWYRGDTYTETSGKISQWTDKSGNLRHLIQADTDYRPLLGATSGPNSTPAIDITDGVSYLYCDATEFDGPLDLPFTIISVHQTAAAFVNVLFDENENDPPVFNAGFYTSFFIGDGSTNLSYGSNFTSWHYHEWCVDDSTPVIRLDGSIQSYSGSIDDTLQMHTIRVGEVRPGVGSYGLDGYIAEMIFIDGILSSGERTSLESYLVTRYGL